MLSAHKLQPWTGSSQAYKLIPPSMSQQISGLSCSIAVAEFVPMSMDSECIQRLKRIVMWTLFHCSWWYSGGGILPRLQRLLPWAQTQQQSCGSLHHSSDLRRHRRCSCAHNQVGADVCASADSYCFYAPYTCTSSLSTCVSFCLSLVSLSLSPPSLSLSLSLFLSLPPLPPSLSPSLSLMYACEHLTLWTHHVLCRNSHV